MIIDTRNKPDIIRIPTIRQHDNPASKTIRQTTIRQQTICQHDNPPTLKNWPTLTFIKKII
jgi:hypothetical protein